MEQLKSRQDELTKTLLANNKALTILASSLESMRLESEQGMARRIQALTLPILERLGRDDRMGRLRDELRVVVEELEDLAAGIGDGEGLLGRLTVSERRIAAMIKSGMSSKQIAANLNISLDTVKTHRRNIRRKLRINDAGASLRGFLQARVGRLEGHDD
ncbi:helix-turn-helix transcriptional regulator [Desulfarculus baarsii]|nr:helix-turn-helix transcriptional regulator [Desulfarculus baarsii]